MLRALCVLQLRANVECWRRFLRAKHVRGAKSDDVMLYASNTPVQEAWRT